MKFQYENQRVLILAPHADDEIIGCGGIIQKFLHAGSSVRVVIASFVKGHYHKFYKDKNQYELYDGKDRLEELKNSHQVIGITDSKVWYMEDENIQYHSQLDAIPKIELVSKIENEITTFQPTIIFIPSETKHQDHTALHEAALAATRPYFWNGSVVVYETDGELSFNPNFFVRLTREEANIKAESLKAYKTQVGTNRHPVNPESLLTYARFRGQYIYSHFAEAFEIKRFRG
ncbi:MAG: PIG-L deacetylase family protein [Tuberibacillus sp.]